MYEYVALAVAVAAVTFGVEWQRVKRKLRLAVKALAAVDSAVADDRVTEAEFREIWMRFKALLED